MLKRIINYNKREQKDTFKKQKKSLSFTFCFHFIICVLYLQNCTNSPDVQFNNLIPFNISFLYVYVSLNFYSATLF